MPVSTSPREYRRAMLELLPPQGEWSEDEYLWLTDRTNRPVEFSDGSIEVLPMPTDEHQGISGFFYTAFGNYLASRGGIVRYSPLRLRLREGRFREPDLMLLRDRADPRRDNRYWRGADLVLEIVSADEPTRDLVEKRREYEAAGIPEYWIVNPLNRTIIVLTLRDGVYAEHGIFAPGAQASSPLLVGFVVAVDDVFASL
jgi:Uma2 family endonuclease